jgi:hypothetical protein
VSSLEPGRDSRVIAVRVAGVAALLIASCYRLGERFREPERRRLVAKDAAEVLRLMLATGLGPLIGRLELLLGEPRTQGLDPPGPRVPR